MRSGERREVARLLATFHLEPVSARIGYRAGELQRLHARSHVGIGLGDYLIAAAGQVQGLELATLHTRHFPMFEGLRPPFVRAVPS